MRKSTSICRANVLWWMYLSMWISILTWIRDENSSPISSDQLQDPNLDSRFNLDFNTPPHSKTSSIQMLDRSSLWISVENIYEISRSLYQKTIDNLRPSRKFETKQKKSILHFSFSYNSHSSQHSLEFDLFQRLHKSVCEHVLSSNISYLNLLTLNIVSNDMKPDFYMLCSWVKDWVLDDTNCTHIITK